MKERKIAWWEYSVCGFGGFILSIVLSLIVLTYQDIEWAIPILYFWIAAQFCIFLWYGRLSMKAKQEKNRKNRMLSVEDSKTLEKGEAKMKKIEDSVWVVSFGLSAILFWTIILQSILQDNWHGQESLFTIAICFAVITTSGSILAYLNYKKN